MRNPFEGFLIVERMMVFEKHLLVEDADGRHFIVAKKLDAPIKQVVYLPMYEIERTH